MRMPATGQTQHTFAQSPKATISRSVFDRSHGHKTSWGANGGTVPNTLIPIYVDEALPGDTFSLKLSAFIRMIPTVVPIMDNLYFDFFFFAVPNRLLWPNWYKFMGAQDNPGDSTSFVNPVVNSLITGFTQGSLADHFGLPVNVTYIMSVNALPFRAYNLIWNAWFRDQNLQNSVYQAFGDGPDTLSNYVPLTRQKRHDYFTSCLPLPQKAAAVNIPFGNNNAPIKSNNADTHGRTYADFTYDQATTTGTSISSTVANVMATNVAPSGTNLLTWPLSTDTHYNYADLSGAWATINQLRQSFQLQKLYERDNRGGTRYTEIIRSHFGVTSPDARLQRPEFLGGGSIPVIMSPVPQTSVTAATPQGNLAAYGTAASNGSIGFSYSATEHCVLIGMMAARADLNYQQGVDRMWSRSTRFDYYWPALAHIGEQGVLNGEIFAFTAAQDAMVFGYQERYGEYRYKPSKITGEFNSNASTPLDYWHLAEKYTTLPTLGATWISAGPPVSRVVAVTTTDPFLGDFFFNLKCARPMPVYSVPGLVDHF